MFNCFRVFSLNQTRNEAIRNLLDVFIPHWSVLGRHQVLVTEVSVDEHEEVECPVQERQEVAEAARRAPNESLDRVGGVVDLARLADPAVDEDFLAAGALDRLGVLEDAAGEVGQRLAANDLVGDSVAHHAEAVLLADGGVEDVVGEAEDGDEQVEEVVGELGGGADLDDEERLDAVEDGDAGEVPEDEHPAELLVVDVPARRHALLALLARVGVEEVAEHQQLHAVGDLARRVVHVERVRERDEEEIRPRDAELSDHLKVDAERQLRVEARAHEVVVDEVARHAHRALRGEAPREDDDRRDVADDDGGREVLAVGLGDLGDVPDVGVPEAEDQREHDVPGRDGVARVGVAVAALGRDGAAEDDGAGHDDGEGPLEEEEDGVRDEAAGRRHGLAGELVPEGGEEGLAVERGVAGVDKLAAPAVDAREGVVDEEVREEEDEDSARGAAELPRAVPLVVLGGEGEGSGSGDGGGDASGSARFVGDAFGLLRDLSGSATNLRRFLFLFLLLLLLLFLGRRFLLGG